MRFSSRMIALLLSLAMLLSALPLFASAEELTEGDYVYQINEDGNSVTITEYTGSETDLTIPSTLGGQRVTVLGNRAFSNNADLLSVTVPSTVTTIESMAFYYCENLAAVNVTPYTLYIGYQAFHGTSFFRAFDLGPVYIGRVLYSYAGLMPTECTITVTPGTASISPYAFQNQRNLKAVYLPVGIRSIGSFAFLGCNNLITMRVPPSVTDIGVGVFLNAGGNVSFYGVTGSTIEAYAKEEKLFFVYDETLDYPDGDVNFDRKLDSRDFRLLMRLLIGNVGTLDAERLASCDLVYNGQIDSADVRALLRAHLGL